MIIGVLSVLIYRYVITPQEIPLSHSYPIILKENQVKEDLHYLFVTLQEVHPNLFRVNDLKTLEKEITNIQQDLGEKTTYLQFLGKLAPFFNRIGCIYTEWGHSADYIQYRNENVKLFPFHLSIVANRIYIKKNFSNDTSIKAGDEILSLNGETPEAYLAKNYPILPVDGHIRTIQRRWLEAYFPNHHSNFWEQPNVFELTLLDQTNHSREVAVDALLKKDFNLIKDQANLKKKPLSYELTGDIATLTIRALLQQKNDTQGQELQSFMDSILADKTSHPQAMILDLRGNGWGLAQLSHLLYSYFISEQETFIERITYSPDVDVSFSNLIELIPFEDVDTSIYRVSGRSNAYTGPVYMLIDGWNAHAKALFCQNMKKRPQTIFAGEETGACSYGIRNKHLKLQLPHSGIEVYIPSAEYVTDSSQYDAMEGIKPDITLDQFPQNEWLDRLKKEVQQLNELNP